MNSRRNGTKPSLGECWNEGAEQQLEPSKLRARCEQYAPIVDNPDGHVPLAKFDIPKGVGLLCAAADVQDDRVELAWLGFGVGEESWLIAHEIVWGNPQDKQTWEQVDALLLKEWRHESGSLLVPSITLVDSGSGGHVDAVYDFVLARQFTTRRVFACKGVKFLSKPQLVMQGQTKRAHIRLFTVATDAAKDRIFKRLEMAQPGPGYVHLPEWCSDEFLAQLVSEQKITVRDKQTRGLKKQYVKIHTRNEALDLTVYCHAGLFVLQNFINPAMFRDLAAIVDRVSKGGQVEPAQAASQRRVRSQGV
jgi:phage terminase large subunit GpA-like protein